LDWAEPGGPQDRGAQFFDAPPSPHVSDPTRRSPQFCFPTSHSSLSGADDCQISIKRNEAGVIVATDGVTNPLSKSAKLALKQLQDSSHLERERRRVNTFSAMSG
jgi:hypothetical protein